MVVAMIYHFYNSKFDAYHQTVNFPVFQPKLGTFSVISFQVFSSSLFSFEFFGRDEKIETVFFSGTKNIPKATFSHFYLFYNLLPTSPILSIFIYSIIRKYDWEK